MSEELKKFSRVLAIILLILLAIQGLNVVSDYVGYASFSGAAGNIYSIIIAHHIPVDEWSGQYGVGVRVDGYNFPQTHVFNGGEVVSNNLLFDCLQPDISHEIYASIYDPNTLVFNSISPATPAEVDALYGLNETGLTSATSTLASSITFNFGGLSITAPGTYTYKIDESGTPATFGMVALKDANGRIFFGSLLTNFTPGFNGEIINYQLLLPMLQNQSSTTYHYFTDPNDNCPAGQGQLPPLGTVMGNVSTSSGTRLENVIVEVAGRTSLSGGTGYYNLSTEEGSQRIYAIKSGYFTYMNNITVVAGNITIHDIIMVEQTNNTNIDIGPGQSDGVGPGQDVGPGEDVGPGQDQGPDEAPPVPFVEQPKQIEGTDFLISLADLYRKVRIDSFVQESLYIYSFKKNTITVTFELIPEEGSNLSNILVLDTKQLIIEPNSNKNLVMTIYGRPPAGVYKGNLSIGGDLNATIPIEIEILPKDRIPVEALLMDLETNQKSVLPGDDFKFKTDLRNLLIDQPYAVSLFYTIQPLDGNETVWQYQTNVHLKTAFSLIRTVQLPNDLPAGDYVLRASASYLGLNSASSTIFYVDIPFWQRTLLGLRYWHWLLILIGILAIAGGGYYVWWSKDSKKKYHLKIEDSEMPKPGPRNIYVGKIAETDKKTYMNLENFKVHTIVAGSTGGGKSVSAQVIIEEALEHDVAVICFDPTAQWTGMLRPCKDKTMLSLFPFYGMKKTDARGFNGNIRMITNAHEIIELKKYIKPGEIQVFACHKLDPKDMDLVVANAIREVFHENFPESKPLKLFLVFDEVHRLLPKFGGSGDGFLQIERGCREFRKWGVGILLISQTLSDFMGTIKANINTEIQMRTRDEGDLDRIKVRYGDEVLRSLVKATVGTGLVENPAYNRGKPYFVAFKPLRHSVERLPDEEIEEYNKYNDLIDDLSYSLEQLEKEGIDVFDLKLELKLSLDKVKTGNFNMVKIYFEGLTPRIDKLWEKLGKKPLKYEKKLVDDSAIKAELAKAKEEHDKAAAAAAAATAGDPNAKKEWGWKDNCPPDKLLNLCNGMVVLSMSSLYDEIAAMKDKDFDTQSADPKNNFADWTLRVTNNENLAENLRQCKKKEEALKVLELMRDGKPIPPVKKAATAAPAPGAAPAQPAAPAAAAPATDKPAEKPAEPAAAPAAAEAKTVPPLESIAKEAPKASGIERLVTTNPAEYLKLENGTEIKSVKELIEYLPKMDDATFSKYVDDKHNQFADWVKNTFHDDQLAGKIAAARTKDQIIAAVSA